jgi:hypothetical protein
LVLVRPNTGAGLAADNAVNRATVVTFVLKSGLHLADDVWGGVVIAKDASPCCLRRRNLFLTRNSTVGRRDRCSNRAGLCFHNFLGNDPVFSWDRYRAGRCRLIDDSASNRLELTRDGCLDGRSCFDKLPLCNSAVFSWYFNQAQHVTGIGGAVFKNCAAECLCTNCVNLTAWLPGGLGIAHFDLACFTRVFSRNGLQYGCFRLDHDLFGHGFVGCRNDFQKLGRLTNKDFFRDGSIRCRDNRKLLRRLLINNLLLDSAELRRCCHTSVTFVGLSIGWALCV